MKRIISYFSIALCLAAVSCNEVVDSTPLKADFGVDQTSVLVGDVVTFNDLSTGKATRWNWTFEGATPETSVLTQPKVQYMDAGEYSVTLSISNPNGSDEITKTAVISVAYHTSVTADFEISNTRAYSTETIKFTNKSTGFPNNIKWTFTSNKGNVVTSTESDPAIVFEPGTYSVKLEVSNPIASDTKEIKDALLILDPNAVTAHIKAPNSTTYEGGKINFVAQTEGPVKSYEWTFEGGNPATSTEANPTVTYNTVGSYKVSLTVRNDNYVDTDEIEGYIHVVPGQDLAFLLPFDGDILDYGPNKINPTVLSMGGLELSYQDGCGRAQSLKFPGGEKGKSYAVLYMPDALKEIVPIANEMTVSWWSKTPAVGANQAIFAQGECPGFAASNQIWCRFQANGQIRCTAEKTGLTGNTSTITNANLQNNEWHNITVVYSNSGKNLVFYFDGVAQAAQNNKSEKDTPVLPYAIGCNLRWTNNAPAPENLYSGLLDDYVFYKRALTAAEVKSLCFQK